MKKFLLFALLFVPTTMMAQQDKDASAGEQSLFEKITKIEKKQDNFHFLLNMNNFLPTASATTVAAYGVDFFAPLKLFAPAVAQVKTAPD